MDLSLKDLIRINQECGETGELQNEGSITYALNIAKHKKNWLYSLSYLIRSLVVDHAFTEGNKRTAFTLTLLYFEDKEVDINKESLVRVITNIASKNVTSIKRISEMIYDARY